MRYLQQVHLWMRKQLTRAMDTDREHAANPVYANQKRRPATRKTAPISSPFSWAQNQAAKEVSWVRQYQSNHNNPAVSKTHTAISHQENRPSVQIKCLTTDPQIEWSRRQRLGHEVWV
jgi:hypothetical protein